MEGGAANITLLLETSAGRVVLRSPPTDNVIPGSHDVLREYKYLTALQGTGVPSPEAILAVEGEATDGAPFYLMREVEGTPPQGASPSLAKWMSEPSRKASYIHHAVDCLAELHSLDWAGLGLAPRRGDYLTRQLEIFDRQLSRTSTGSRLVGIDAITKWLWEYRPRPQRISIVHGDYSLHNMILSSGSKCRVQAILDWELASLGDPLCDLAWFERRLDPSEKVDLDPAWFLLQGQGVPPLKELASRYADRSGIDADDIDYYRIFARWKTIILWEQLYDQYVKGSAANPARVSRFESAVPEMVEKLQQRWGQIVA